MGFHHSIKPSLRHLHPAILLHLMVLEPGGLGSGKEAERLGSGLAARDRVDWGQGVTALHLGCGKVKVKGAV